MLHWHYAGRLFYTCMLVLIEDVFGCISMGFMAKGYFTFIVPVCNVVQTLATPRVLYGKVETHFRIHVNKGAQATF